MGNAPIGEMSSALIPWRAFACLTGPGVRSGRDVAGWLEVGHRWSNDDRAVARVGTDEVPSEALERAVVFDQQVRR